MQLVGTIKQLQIQRDRLKPGEGPNRRYDPAPILTVDALQLTSCGVIGLTADGGEIIDVHHVNHPASRNRNNANGVSLNFTANYDRMRQRFGAHIWDGCGGENLLIALTSEFRIDNLETRLAIEDSATGNLTYLEDLMVAAPCAEFSCYVNQASVSGETLKHTLQFLADGTRGFYAALAPAQDETVIHAEDRVYAVFDI